MNFNKIYENVLKRLKEENDVTEEDNKDEYCEEDNLEEYSVAASIGGGPATPLGTNAYGKVGKPSDWFKKNKIK